MSAPTKSVFKSSILFHVAGWVIFFIAPFLLSPPNEFNNILSDPGNIESIVLRNLVLMVLFYFNLLYLTPVLLKNNSVGILLLVLIVAVVVVSVINTQIHHFLAEPFRGGPRGDPPPDDFRPGPGPRQGPRPMMLAGPLFSSFLITVMVATVSTTIVLWKDWVKARAAEQERAFQRVASELAVLKLQISPHFLFNTLNNIRWLVRSKSDQAEEAVMKLSQLLRYILYQTTQEKVVFEKEIQNLKDYVSLQQMRLTEHQNFLFTFDGEVGNKIIVPLLFIPLVENVFKFGDFSASFQNRVSLMVDNDRLIFESENLVLNASPSDNEEESGIGLTNVKKRLMLHYPDRHSLDYSEKDGIFRLTLEIILN